MLFTGFIGSADWSMLDLPIPYPLPFGSSESEQPYFAGLD
jgi:hypothetical protein